MQNCKQNHHTFNHPVSHRYNLHSFIVQSPMVTFRKASFARPNFAGTNISTSLNISKKNDLIITKYDYKEAIRKEIN